MELPSDDIARQIANRSVTLKYVSELWASSNKVEDLHADLKKYCADILQNDKEFQKSTFKFNVEVFCNTQTYAEKMTKIEVSFVFPT